MEKQTIHVYIGSMKQHIIVYYGSPHIHGNSAFLADVFSKQAKEKFEKVDKVYLDKQVIHACKACDYCKNHPCTCVQNDDMEHLIPEFIKADGICFATSVYWWGMTAQLKLFVDRLYMLPHEVFKGKELYVIAVGEDSLDGIQYQLIDRQFKEIAEYLHMEYKGYLPVSADADRPAKENKEAIDKAIALLN